MNRNAKRWLKALRSGAYEQTSCYMRRIDAEGTSRYCVLGVACEISGLGAWKGVSYLGATASLPDEVQRWLGLTTRNGQTRKDGTRYARNGLTSLNDSGIPFAELADFIEKHQESLFGQKARKANA